MLRGAQKLLGESLRCRAEVESRTRPKTHKKIRSQGQGQPFRGQTLSRPRTGILEAKDTSASDLQKEKLLQKNFSDDEQKRNTKKILIFRTKFSARFLAFSNVILRVQKNCCPRAEHRAIFEDLRLRGQELQNVSSTPRTSSRTLPLLPGPDAFGMRQQSGEYFAPNSMLSS